MGENDTVSSGINRRSRGGDKVATELLANINH
jgi:hypothetical protein